MENLKKYSAEQLASKLNSRDSERFKKLYNGDLSGYPSHTEADVAFCKLLAVVCSNNSAMMDEIFRSSGLMRDKWDSKRSDSTYGKMTIEFAIRSID